VRFKRVLPTAMLAAACALVAACGSSSSGSSSHTTASGGGGASSGGGAVKIEVVTHGQVSVPFWATFKHGVDDAAKAEGVSVDYQAPETFDMVRMSQLLDAAVAKHPDGIVLTIPDAKALGPAIKRAVASGVPVISVNSGADAYKGFGIELHIGQQEYQAGYQGGQKMAAAGVKQALCLNGEVGNAALDQRCAGFKAAMAKAGGTTKEVGVKLADPNYTKQTTQAAIASNHPDGIFNTTNAVAMPALDAIKASGQAGKIKEATFDLGPDELKAVQRGDMLFAIDQQEYLQGYLPIVFLALQKRVGVVPGNGGVIPTGPAFVTKDNAGQVIDLSAKGLR
jgi:simple sugar transport system substrate-binding protein